MWSHTQYLLPHAYIHLIHATASTLTVPLPALEALLDISLRTLNSFVGKYIYLSTMENELIRR